jgi:putative nucleotidyltransferase with HDIG domain
MLWQRFCPRALSLSLLHPENDELELLAQRGEPIDAAPGWRTLVGGNDEGAVLAGHNDLVGERSGYDPSHIVCLTLRTSDRPVGILRLVRDPEQPGFAADDRKLLVVCASQIAASLENIRLYQQLKAQNLQIISAFADMIDARDPYTRGHSEQVTRYATRLAEVIGFSSEQIERIKYGALLHDIGKIGVRDSVLLKAGQLNDAEVRQVRQHPQIGVGILRHIKSLADVLPIIQSHHERLDGKGYPEGRRSDEIPVEAKIIAIADSFDAMTTNRSYRQAMCSEEAIRVLLRGRGHQWDANLVDAFVAMIKQEGDGLLVSEARPPQPTLQTTLATAPMAD